MSDSPDASFTGPHPWRDPGVLEELYVERQLSIHQISDALACSNETVGRWLDEHGIETREATWEKTPPELKDAEWLRHYYLERHHSARQIAERLECAATTVRTWVDKHGLGRRSRAEAIRARALHEPARYGIDSEGYARWRVFRDGDRQEVRVHRLLAVAEEGFEALADNHVHHKNHLPWDNRPENIQVVSPEKHAKIHANEESGGELA
jgi:hypothetical protein